MKTVLLVLSGVILLQGCASPPSGAIRGRGATYHYVDWRDQPAQEAFDVPAAPAGGMVAFIRHLDYPANLRARHVGGQMKVIVSLDSTGRVLDAHVTQSVDPQLDRIVLEAVRRTKWLPAQRNGVAIPLKFSFSPTFTPP